MGQDQLDAGVKPAGTNAEKLNQVLKDNQFISVALRDKFMSDAMAPPSDSLGQRLMTVTKEAVNQVPQAFANSFDAKNVLPNVAIGFGFGSAMRAVLPEAGPVGKAAGGALGAWFVGKPLVESYYMAATATTNADMYNASHHLAETIGGLPVTAVEAAAGAKLGTMAAGKFMGSAMGQPLVAWKARQYERLDTKLDSADVALKNAASKDIGLGNGSRGQNRDNAFRSESPELWHPSERGHGPEYREFRSNSALEVRSPNAKTDSGQNRDNAFGNGSPELWHPNERGHGPEYREFRSNSALEVRSPNAKTDSGQNRDNAFGNESPELWHPFERGHGPEHRLFRANPALEAKSPNDGKFSVSEQPSDLSIAILYENRGGTRSAVGTETRYDGSVFTDLLKGADNRGLSFNPKARVPDLEKVQLDLSKGDPQTRALVDGVRNVLRARLRAERDMNGPSGDK